MDKRPLEHLTWEELAKEITEADEAYGCGFYSDDRWRAAYRELKQRAGWVPEW